MKNPALFLQKIKVKNIKCLLQFLFGTLRVKVDWWVKVDWCTVMFFHHFFKGRQLSIFTGFHESTIPFKRCLLLTLLHSEWPKLHTVLAMLSAIVLKSRI